MKCKNILRINFLYIFSPIPGLQRNSKKPEQCDAGSNTGLEVQELLGIHGHIHQGYLDPLHATWLCGRAHKGVGDVFPDKKIRIIGFHMSKVWEKPRDGRQG